MTARVIDGILFYHLIMKRKCLDIKISDLSGIISISYNTGNNFANAVLAIYQYNITQDSWQMLDTGGEGCEFIGDKIKVQKYEYDDYYNHNEEWKDIISWIELR